MHFIPFPITLAETSSENAKRQYEARKGKRASDHTSEGVACYLDEAGKLHMAHDPYDPKYPYGATPGLGTVHARLKFFPNDTSGYDFHVTDFTPAADLLANCGMWENPCVAIRKDIIAGEPYSQGRMMAAPSETALSHMMPDNLNLCIRPSVVCVGMEQGNAPEAAVYMAPAGKMTVVIGGARAIAEAMVDKYDVNMPSSAALDHRKQLNPDLDEDNILLAEITERLKDRYSFNIEMAGPGELHVAEAFDLEMPEM